MNPPKRPPDAVISDVTTADQVKFLCCRCRNVWFVGERILDSSNFLRYLSHLCMFISVCMCLCVYMYIAKLKFVLDCVFTVAVL